LVVERSSQHHQIDAQLRGHGHIDLIVWWVSRGSTGTVKLSGRRGFAADTEEYS
jgi:hypothetical protein